MPHLLLCRLSGSLELEGEAPDHLMCSMRMQDPTSNIDISLLIMCINSSEKALLWVLDDQATFEQLLLVAFLVVGGASRCNTREAASISTRTRKLDSIWPVKIPSCGRHLFWSWMTSTLPVYAYPLMSFIPKGILSMDHDSSSTICRYPILVQ